MKSNALNSFISIHSLHTEGDHRYSAIFPVPPYFNPLPPHGGRLTCPQNNLTDAIFQSTPSTRRETSQFLQLQFSTHISIHSLHTEGDSKLESDGFIGKHFNPLPPHGGRPCSRLAAQRFSFPFQSTPSTRRETIQFRQGIRHFRKFQSTPSTRRETPFRL